MPLTAGAINSALSQNTNEAWVILMTITHADLPDPIRLAYSNTAITSNGEVFQACPFRVDWPQDRDNDLPRVKVAIGNVDRAIVNAVRSITTAPDFVLQVVLKSAPDDLQASAEQLTLKNVTWDQQWVTGDLSFENVFQEPIGRTFDPVGFPALHKSIR